MKLVEISKSYGSSIVLRGFSADIEEGKTTLIMGQSGSGKTTLMRIIAGLDSSYSGKVEGKPFSPVILFQEDRLIQNMSARGNLKAVSKDEERMCSLLSRLGLRGEMDKKINELSGGMKRRVAIARMLLLEGDCYILDEPFSGLDGDTRMKVASVIRDELEGKTVLVVTHEESDGDLLSAAGRINIGERYGK